MLKLEEWVMGSKKIQEKWKGGSVRWGDEGAEFGPLIYQGVDPSGRRATPILASERQKSDPKSRLEHGGS